MTHTGMAMRQLIAYGSLDWVMVKILVPQWHKCGFEADSNFPVCLQKPHGVTATPQLTSWLGSGKPRH